MKISKKNSKLFVNYNSDSLLKDKAKGLVNAGGLFDAKSIVVEE